MYNLKHYKQLLICFILGLLICNQCFALSTSEAKEAIGNTISDTKDVVKETAKKAKKAVKKTVSAIDKKMTEMGLTLPKITKPAGDNVSYTVVGNLIFVSGQLPIEDGKVKYTGKLGDNVSDKEGKEAARLCALNILAHLKSSIGSLDKVKRCVKVYAFVNSNDDFKDYSKIGNSASDLFVDIFGNKGKHTKVAVGVPSLPLNAAVQIDAVFEVE